MRPGWITVLVLGTAPFAFSQADGNPELTLSDVTVGKYLQATATLGVMRTVVTQDFQVTLTSGEADKILFSETATTAGKPTLTVTFRKGQREVEIFVQALADSGTVNYTAKATGFNSGTGKAQLTPSGLAISGPYGVGKEQFITTTGIPRQLSVHTARLDASHNYAASQPLAGGRTVKLKVNNANTKIGAAEETSLEIAGGSARAVTMFFPSGAGETDLSLADVSGLPLAERYAKVQAKVLAPAMKLVPTVVGFNLMAASSIMLGEPAPAKGLEAKIVCENPGHILMSQNNAPGTPTLTLKVPAGQSSAQFVIEAVGAPRDVNCTVSAPGFGQHTAAMTVAPAGVILTGPASITRSGVAHGFTASAAAGKTIKMIAYTAYLDPTTHRAGDLTVQPLRRGVDLRVDMKTADPEIGTVASPITIPSGKDNAETVFTPLKAGRTTVNVLTPAGGYLQPANATSILALITP